MQPAIPGQRLSDKTFTTTFDGISYTRWLATVGTLGVLAGVVLFLVGRPDNAGLPIAGAGLLSLVLAAATAATRRR